VVDENTEKNLLSIFNEIEKVIEMAEQDTFEHLSISYFNHWLSEDEAKEFLVNVSPKEQRKRDRKFLYFSKILLQEMDVYGYMYLHKKRKNKYVEFTSKKQLLRYMNYGSRFIIVIPKIESIYVYGFDDTTHLYYKNKKILEEIDLFVSQAKLHII
jgi:hypothetical protein